MLIQQKIIFIFHFMNPPPLYSLFSYGAIVVYAFPQISQGENLYSSSSSLLRRSPDFLGLGVLHHNHLCPTLESVPTRVSPRKLLNRNNISRRKFDKLISGPSSDALKPIVENYIISNGLINLLQAMISYILKIKQKFYNGHIGQFNFKCCKSMPWICNI